MLLERIPKYHSYLLVKIRDLSWSLRLQIVICLISTIMAVGFKRKTDWVKFFATRYPPVRRWSFILRKGMAQPTPFPYPAERFIDHLNRSLPPERTPPGCSFVGAESNPVPGEKPVGLICQHEPICQTEMIPAGAGVLHKVSNLSHTERGFCSPPIVPAQKIFD